MDKIYAFVDEFGAFGFDFSKSGCSTHFLLSAIIVKNEDISRVEEEAERIRLENFQAGEMKSSKVGTNHTRRMKILNELRQLPFNIFLFVCDKREVYQNSGLRFKKSFYKFLNNFVYSELRLAYNSLVITADETGSNDFLLSFKEYIKRKEVRTTLFDDSEFRFEDSKNSVIVQIADFISGTLAFSYDEKKKSENNGINYLSILQDKILRIEEFPRKFESFNVSQTSINPLYNANIANTCYRQAKHFIDTNSNTTDIEIKKQIAVLKYLLFRFMNNSPRKYIPTKELINQLVYLGYDKISTQNFRMRIIAKLRDNGVIISSSPNGYKIPSTEQELYDFVNHGKSIIMPMLSRLKLCNDIIRMGTNGDIKLFEKAEYNALGKLLEEE